MIEEIEMTNTRGILMELLCCAYMSVLGVLFIEWAYLVMRNMPKFVDQRVVSSPTWWSDGHIFIIYKMDHILFSQWKHLQGLVQKS